MHISQADIKDFYNSEIGGIVQNILQRHINNFWSDNHGLRVMGCGYAAPYIDGLGNNTERSIAMSMDQQSASPFLSKSNKNMMLISNEANMPIESCSIDRILLIHHLEFCDNLQESLREIWRILKANGRLLVVVPNRMGLWARYDSSPFGVGRPFTSSQLSINLRDNLFIQEGHKSALFVPPIPDSPVLMKSANFIEKMGGSVLPFVAGVHMVEASKQIYASIDKTGGGSAVLAKTKEILTGGRAGGAKPVPQGFKSKSLKSPKDYRG